MSAIMFIKYHLTPEHLIYIVMGRNLRSIQWFLPFGMLPPCVILFPECESQTGLVQHAPVPSHLMINSWIFPCLCEYYSALILAIPPSHKQHPQYLHVLEIKGLIISGPGGGLQDPAKMAPILPSSTDCYVPLIMLILQCENWDSQRLSYLPKDSWDSWNLHANTVTQKQTL